MIEIPSRAVRDYLVSFGVVAIFVTSVGKLGIGRDLARAAPLAAAWWVRDRRTAEQILIAIGEEHPQTVEEATRAVEAAAARLGVTLNDHAAVMQRTRAAVDRLNGKLEAARRNGNLQLFNRAYHAYRLGCQQRGEHAMAEKEIDALNRVIVEVEQQRDDALAERTSLLKMLDDGHRVIAEAKAILAAKAIMPADVYKTLLHLRIRIAPPTRS